MTDEIRALLASLTAERFAPPYPRPPARTVPARDTWTAIEARRHAMTDRDAEDE